MCYTGQRQPTGGGGPTERCGCQSAGVRANGGIGVGGGVDVGVGVGNKQTKPTETLNCPGKRFHGRVFAFRLSVFGPGVTKLSGGQTYLIEARHCRRQPADNQLQGQHGQRDQRGQRITAVHAINGERQL